MVSTVGMGPASEWMHSGDPLTGLVTRIAGGDEPALAELYDATCRMVYGLTLRITGDTAAAEELTLEVYMQVWRTAESYSPERGRVSAWIVMLARSRAIDWLRSRRGRGAALEDSLEEAVEVRDRGRTPEVAYLETERSRAIRNAMAELPEEQRQAIELAYFGGMSHGEIAAHAGLPLGTVKARIRLGMLRLREALDEYAGGL